MAGKIASGQRRLRVRRRPATSLTAAAGKARAGAAGQQAVAKTHDQDNCPTTSVLRGSGGREEAAAFDDKAEWAARLPQPAQRLLRRKSFQGDDEAATAAAAQFRGIYWNKGWQRFRAVVNGKSFGQHIDLADAVAAVARATGVEVGSLWKIPGSSRPYRLFCSQQADSELDTSLASSSSSSVAAPAAAARFGAFPAFVAAHGLPRDLDDMLRRLARPRPCAREQAAVRVSPDTSLWLLLCHPVPIHGGLGSHTAKLYKQYPVILLASCSMKFGPVRDVLESVALEALKCSAGIGGVLDGPMLRQILVALVRRCQGMKMPDWVASNANVQSHSGFLPFLQRVGIIAKLSAGHVVCGRSVVTLGEMDSSYEVVNGPTLNQSLCALAALGPPLDMALQRPQGPQLLGPYCNLTFMRSSVTLRCWR